MVANSAKPVFGTTPQKVFGFTCIKCTQDTDVTDHDVRLAVLEESQVGAALVSCSHCGKVYTLPSQIPTGDFNALEQWVIQAVANPDWLLCLPLGGMVAIEPAGAGNESPTGSGLIYYTPGSGITDSDHPDGFLRYEYMAFTGWDPVILWSLMKSKPKRL